MKEVSYQQMMEKHPERILEHAVRRMLPKTKTGKRMFTRLKVYKGEEHPHKAQQPVIMTSDNRISGNDKK